MSNYMNNGTYSQSGYYYPGMSQHQNVPVTRNPSGTDMYASYTPNPWPNYASPDASFPAYSGGSWQGGHHPHQTRTGGPPFSASPSGTTGVHMHGGMGVETNRLFNHSMSSVSGQPHSQHPMGWQQTSHPTWTHPEHTVRRHSDERGSTSVHGTRTEGPYQPTSHPVNAGHRVSVQTGHPHPANAPAPRSDPVPTPVTASPTRSRGEWWDPIDAPMSYCQWVTHGRRCGTRIAGDRRSVTSHLRDRHGDFSSDGKTIQCEWVGCTASMQRRNIPRHILACHLEVKVTCPGCGMSLSRADAGKKHQQACPKAFGGDEDDGVY